MRFRIFVFALCLFLMVWSCLLTGHAQTHRPNMIVIMTDDIGYGDIGPYGVTDIRTPHLDRLASEGVRVPNHYSNGPVCTPTRAALASGRYQQRFGLEWVVGPGAKVPGLPVAENALSRTLKNNGYATALFGKWHLGFTPEYGPNAHEFAEFFGILGGDIDLYSQRTIGGQPGLYENTTLVEREGYLTDLLTDRARHFISQRRPHPFFLFLAYNAPHWPFQPSDRPDDVRTPATWFNGTREDYARMVERVDHGVSRVLQTVEHYGLAHDTLVIFTNDNGGERLSRNESMFHLKATLWEGGIRVPHRLNHLDGFPQPAHGLGGLTGAPRPLRAVISGRGAAAWPSDREHDIL